LQIGVDVGEILVGKDFGAVGRHRPIGRAHECDERLRRKRVRPEFRPGDGALPDRTVTLPAPILDEQALAFLGRCRHGNTAAEDQSNGRELNAIPDVTHDRSPQRG
jgi:hypothetical protein